MSNSRVDVHTLLAKLDKNSTAESKAYFETRSYNTKALIEQAESLIFMLIANYGKEMLPAEKDIIFKFLTRTTLAQWRQEQCSLADIISHICLAPQKIFVDPRNANRVRNVSIDETSTEASPSRMSLT